MAKTRFLSIDECCSCNACIDICPVSALSLCEDKNGFYYPHFERSLCLDCHLCEKVCNSFHPENIRRNDERKAEPYAAWTKNEELIKRSASGGVFAQLACDFLKKDNSYVYGASLLSDNTVAHIEISSQEQIKELQNSKYQQSNTVGIYKQVRKRLREGAWVLFSGVPCQVAAIYAFLQDKKELIERLFTIEVLCHGVPTNVLSRKALEYHNAKKIVSYRTKVLGGGAIGNRLTYEMYDGSIMKCNSHIEDFLFKSYLTFSFSRISCYKCHYGNINRVADITLADFWEKERSPKAKLYENYYGTSVAVCNNLRGKGLLMKSSDMYLQKISWDEFLPYNQNMYMPTNTQRYIASKYLFLINHLPRFVQNVIFRDGFGTDKRNVQYEKIWEFFYHWNIKRQKKYRDKEEKCKSVLSYLCEGNN